MALLPASEKFVVSFLAAIAPVAKAYIHAAFNYIAIKVSDRFEIVQARV